MHIEILSALLLEEILCLRKYYVKNTLKMKKL